MKTDTSSRASISSRASSRASLDAAGEPGLTAYTKVSDAYEQGAFEGVESVDQFASLLGVPKSSIALVVPLDAPCKSDGCPFKGIARNGNRCPFHQRTWYPLKNIRGDRMIGPEFLRPESGNRATCDCKHSSCLATGYSPNQAPLRVPAVGRETVLHTPGLLSDEARAAIQQPGGTVRLNYWHFFPRHRKTNSDGRWELVYDKKGATKYYDDEGYSYNFPPPRYNASLFVSEEYCIGSYVRPRDRWAVENEASKMPTWMLDMLLVDGNTLSKPSAKMTKGELHRTVDMWRARAHQLDEEKRGQKRKYDEMIDAAAVELEKVKIEKDLIIKARDEEIARLKEENARLQKELEELRQLLKECQERKGQPLTYDDLYEGGVLSKHVDAFTLFKTVEQNDAFLELINFADGSEGAFPEGDGLCENLRAYSKVSMEERAGEVDPPSLDADEWQRFLKLSKAHKKRTWKDDYLSWCFYVHSGSTQAFAAGISGVSTPRMSDIFHEWSQVLDTALQEMFPRPTRSQLLHAYPQRFLEADGHARCGLLLDAFEVFAQASHNPNVASSTHSDYKKHCTVKFLGGVDPIGCPWAGTVPDGSPGKASDPIMTKDTQILRQVHYGNTCKVDKGFIVDDIGASEGVVIDRPQIRKRGQVQQSAYDTAQTQKLGNTRIIVENVNGELKLHIRWLNVLIPCSQYGIVSQVVRVGYLLQNFKKAIIQRRNPNEKSPEGGRPCRAEIRWYGGTDTGLVDIRADIEKWGMKCEIQRHGELAAKDENKSKSKLEISEMVLAERWDLKRRREHYRLLRGVEYDGGDL